MLIGEVANQHKAPIETLRYYDRIGLLSPQRRGGLRRYSAADLEKLTVILKMKALMFSLAEIQALLAADAEFDHSLGQGKPDLGAAKALLELVTAKLTEIGALEEKIKAVKATLQGYARKVEDLLGAGGNDD